MRGDSPCADVEVPRAVDAATLVEVAVRGDAMVDVVVRCRCRGSRT
jgi:hypothetical protein